jgi:hypothetical protein
VSFAESSGAFSIDGDVAGAGRQPRQKRGGAIVNIATNAGKSRGAEAALLEDQQ